MSHRRSKRRHVDVATESAEAQDVTSIKKEFAQVKQEHGDECGEPAPLPPDQATVSKYFNIKKEGGSEAAQAHLPKAKKAKEPPKNWEQALENIRIMRAKKDAPVDSCGCEVLHDTTAPPEVQRFQILVALMLSAQTKDEVTAGAVRRLQALGLTAQNIIDMPEEKLGQTIHPVGFWRKKAVYLKKAAELIVSEHQGDIPKTIEGLVSLPGVGIKMATITMSVANRVITGIGVDTHVHRIGNRLGWAKTNSPEDTQRVLESWMPHEVWGEINLLMVGFGQTICQPRVPRCADCLNRDICPSSTAKTRKPRAKALDAADAPVQDIEEH